MSPTTMTRAAPASAGPDRRPGLAIWTLVLASIGEFLTALDAVVVATALPVLRVDLGASLADLEWTVNAYALTFACLMLTGAALGDRFGRRRMYVVGVLVFSAASAAAALSGTVGALIAARVVQGAGAAVIMPLTLVLIVDAFPAAKRGAAIGVWGAITGIGVASGPVLGGAITEGISWPWIFWINVPIGLVVAALSMVRLRESHGPRPQLDLPGLLLAASGMFFLAWAPVRAPSIGWTSTEVLASLAAGAALTAGFLRWERRARYPMLPLAHFRRRGFATANAVTFLQFLSLSGALFIISQLFQNGLGHSPLQAGLRILVWTGTLMVVAPIAGVLADRLGDRIPIVLGMALQGIGLGWLAMVVEPGVGYGSLVLPLVLSGVGTSLAMPPVANLVTRSVPEPDAGVAAGTSSALRQLGGVFGIALVALMFAEAGSYATPETFIDGFVPAIWAASAVALLAVVPALLAPKRAPATAGRNTETAAVAH